MIPSVGRIVAYTLTETDAEQINKRRQDARVSGIAATNSGAVVHFGNPVLSGEICAMVIVHVWGTHEGASVNGQVLLDGNDSLWVTSVTQGDGPRQFHEFPRV